MTRKLTKDALIEFMPCEIDERLALFGKSSALTVRQAFNRGFTIRHLLWVAGKLGLKAECANFARECADRVKHIKVRCAADDAAAAAYAAYAAYAADAAYAAYAADDAAARAKEVEAQKKIFIRIFG